MNKSPRRCIIGIDGGGSRSAGFLVSLDGEVLAQVTGGPLNFHSSSWEAFRKSLEDLLARLTRGAASGVTMVRAVVGTAALFTSATADESQRALQGLFAPELTRLVGDALVAMFGAAAGKPGILISAGTGSIAVSLDAEGTFRTAGGFGPLIGGDPGSAFWIASEAILAAERKELSSGHPTELGDAIRDYFSVKSLPEIISVVYGHSDGCARLAGLAGVLSRSGLAEEKTFLEIQREAGRTLAKLAGPLWEGASNTSRVGNPVFFAGSVLRFNPVIRDALLEQLREGCGRSVELSEPILGPAAGAALWALRDAGVPTTNEIVRALGGASKESDK